MPKLAIISRNYSVYEKALYELQSSGEVNDIELIWSNEHADGAPLAEIEFALANPNIMSKYINDCHQLIWLQSTWAGVNSLIKKEKCDYQLSGLKNIFGAQMREYVMAYVLYFQRKIPELIENQQEHAWQQHHIPTLQGQTMGIMGLGSIGKEVAKAAKLFGMNINSLTTSSKPSEADKHFHLESLLEFAKSADVIVNLLPHTDKTTGICDAAFFQSMRDHSVFINAGRGNVIKNDNDLAQVLHVQKLRAAVIDVFKTEPLPKDHPFWDTPNLLISNHTAATSQHQLVFQVFKDNLKRILKGAAPDSRIDMSLGY
jgi:phosphoglycerate dehydrogenase-like enzyme